MIHPFLSVKTNVKGFFPTKKVKYMCDRYMISCTFCFQTDVKNVQVYFNARASFRERAV